jgi:hypothetical protein
VVSTLIDLIVPLGQTGDSGCNIDMQFRGVAGGGVHARHDNWVVRRGVLPCSSTVFTHCHVLPAVVTAE